VAARGIDAQAVKFLLDDRVALAGRRFQAGPTGNCKVAAPISQDAGAL
jgi:hypothetical protein